MCAVTRAGSNEGPSLVVRPSFEPVGGRHLAGKATATTRPVQRDKRMSLIFVSVNDCLSGRDHGRTFAIEALHPQGSGAGHA